MTEEEFEKKVKGTKTFCIIIGILFAIGIFSGIAQQNIVTTIMSFGFIILLYLFYSLSKKKKTVGPIIGIILGTLYILQLNILSIIIGICILVDCISMIKYIKEIKQGEVSKKEVVFSIIAIVVIGILILLGSLGMKIMEEASNISESNTNSNIDNVNDYSNSNSYYYSNGVTFTYGSEWTEEYIEEQGETYTTLENKSESIVFTCSGVQELDDYDYTQESNRQKAYDELMNYYQTYYSTYYGRNLTNQSSAFKLINNDLYYAFFEIDGSLYSRFYIILNTQENEACSCTILSANSLTNMQESKVIDIIKTVEF